MTKLSTCILRRAAISLKPAKQRHYVHSCYWACLDNFLLKRQTSVNTLSSKTMPSFLSFVVYEQWPDTFEQFGLITLYSHPSLCIWPYLYGRSIFQTQYFNCRYRFLTNKAVSALAVVVVRLHHLPGFSAHKYFDFSGKWKVWPHYGPTDTQTIL